LESVRERRKRRLETEQLFARAGDEELTDPGILVEAHPLNALEDAGMARRIYRAVERLFDAPPEAAVREGRGRPTSRRPRGTRWSRRPTRRAKSPQRGT